MVKKIIFWLGGLVPLCVANVAGAAPLNIGATDASVVVGTGAGETYDSINVADSIFVGIDNPTSPTFGSFYAETGVDTDYSMLSNGGIVVGTGVTVANGKVLTIGGATSPVVMNLGALEIQGGLTISNAGAVTLTAFNGSGASPVSITATGLSVTGTSFQTQGNFAKNVAVNLGNGTFSVTNGAIENQTGGVMVINAGAVVAKTMVNGSNSGTLQLDVASLTLNGGDSDNASMVNKGTFIANVSGQTSVTNGFNLGPTGTFALTTGTFVLGGRVDEFYNNNLGSFNLTVQSGDVNANAIVNGATNSLANMQLNAKNINAISITNSAHLDLIAQTAINVSGDAGIVNTAGVMNINAPTINVKNIAASGNSIMHITGGINGLESLSAVGALLQNGVMTNGAVNFKSNDYTLVVNNDVTVGGILQQNQANTFLLKTDNLIVGTGGIDVKNFTIQNNTTAGTVISVGGNVSGGLGAIGVKSATINGNYTFDENSTLLTIINPESAGANYWGSANFDGVIGTIVTSESAEPLISITGQLISNVGTVLDITDGGALQPGQFGLYLASGAVPQQSSVIWLARADAGITSLASAIDSLKVGFCGIDGTGCYGFLAGAADDGSDLKPYLLVRGNNLYVVFDERFKAVMGIPKLQPIVATTNHAHGAYQSAGALDNVIETQLLVNGYSYESQLYVVNDIFNGTPLNRVGAELYGRLKDYIEVGDGNPIRNFSRLFQPREANLIADSIAQNGHFEMRDLADRFIDESIWNRHRRLNKLWLNANYTIFNNDLDDIRGDGMRFAASFGYDWQSSETWILGFTGHVSHTRTSFEDDIDLGYAGSGPIMGRADADVNNLNVGAGIYFMNILGHKSRLYGTAMVDFNMIDVERNQTWVDTATGDASSYGVLAELGLIHDWLNQYIVGNLYARVGYNFGFDLTEQIAGTDYINMNFDGHLVLNPGYSLTAQKRIYPSAWFQMRPYATVGIEYDVLGTPDTMQYKFAQVSRWTDYDIEIDPLWAIGGVGIEFLGVNGWHVGVGYRYQYNATIQAHKINLSAMYRF